MSVDSDAGDADIRAAYQSISQNGSLNWLLLSYGKWAGGLKLFAAGSQGISELKTHMNEDNVFFAFCRERTGSTDYFATVAYIPEGVSGLRKSRAFATSRIVQSWFKMSQAAMTISHLDALTTESLVQSIRSQLPPSSLRTDIIMRSSSEYPDSQKSPPSPSQEGFRRSHEGAFRRSHSVGPDSRNASPGPSRFRSPAPDFGDPIERAKKRDEAQRQQQLEDETAAREEERRQARIKRDKADILRRHEEEENRRRASLEEDLRRAAMLKAEKEQEEKLAAESRALERELKKKLDAEKRLAEAHRIEAWRREEQKRLDELVRQEDEARLRAQEAKQASLATAFRLREERVASGDSILLRGWVTIQAPSLVWRRRWFELSATKMQLYKNDKDLVKVLDTIELTGRIRDVKEWRDGFEELRAIPHSFAIDFADNQEPLFAYTDSVEEKENLVGFLLTYV